MRKIFWDERFWPRYKAGDLIIRWNDPTPRKKPIIAKPEGEYNQEFRFIDPNTNEEIMRCHWFLASDKKTPVSRPDPKAIFLAGASYHLIGKSSPACEHCAAGIDTYPTEPQCETLP